MTSLASRGLLKLLGWQSFNHNNKLSEHKYIVCVFSHTSYYDFFIMLLYKYGYYDYFYNLTVVIRPDYFQYPLLGKFLKYIGGIEGSQTTCKNGGKVNYIVDKIKENESSKFLICPKGTIVRGEWRTGYYHIAKTLNAPLCVVGLDYERKNVYIGDAIPNTAGETTIKQQLYNELGQIVPLHPEQENMPIRDHNSYDVSVTSTPRLFCSVGLGVITLLGVSIGVYKGVFRLLS